MSVTQKDIANKLGVSQRLISYALNGQKGVGEAMRQRILREAGKMGYTPNRMAQALVTGKTQQIAIWFQFATTLNHEMMLQFHRLTRHSSYHLLSISNAGQAQPSIALPVDGGIFYGSIPAEFATSFPVVEMLVDLRGKSAGEPPRNDLILMPMEEASRAAMQHLIAQNYRRIAYTSVASMMANYEPRYRAYISQMRKAGLPVEKIVLEWCDDGGYRSRTQATLQKYFSEQGVPDALFCSNDDIAIGAYRALRQMGRRIPEDTAVIGCDDIEESQDHVPSLTSIQFPCEEICRCAWEMLTSRIANPALSPRTKTFKARLVVRESTARSSIFNREK